MELESSTETTAPADAGADVKPAAGSSPAGIPAQAQTPKVEAKAPGEKPSMLDAVKAALKPKTDTAPKSDSPDSEPGTKDAATQEGDDAEVTGDFTEEEKARLSRKTKKRINELLGERAARDQAIEQIRPKADQFDRLVKFVNEANLSRDEVNELFDIGRELKNTPERAYARLKPVFQRLQVMFGDVLPEDLQQQVARGQILPDRARELAVLRTNAGLAQGEAARLREQQDRRQVGDAQQAYVGEVRTKVSEWEASKEKSDPDWKLKQPFVMQAVTAALMTRGKPPTPAEAIEIANSAVAEVEKSLKSFAPRPREVRAVTNVSSTPSTAKPATALEAARQGLAKARSAA